MTNPLKTIRMLRSFWLLSQDPNRLEQVFEIGDTGENQRIFAEVAAFVSQDPQGARAFREMPRIGNIDLQELVKLPEGTLGRVFADHMIANGLDPKAIPVPHVAPGDLRYVKAHLRETHDVWHVVTGFNTDVAGEIGLQAFYLAQLPSRLSAVLIAMAFVHLATKNMDPRDALVGEIMRGFAIGKRAKMFFGFEWAKHWATPIADVRKMLDVVPDLDVAALPKQQAYYAKTAEARTPKKDRYRKVSAVDAAA
ncbi:MAG: Coq4 family protein [Polyangiaceae bacterium]